MLAMPRGVSAAMVWKAAARRLRRRQMLALSATPCHYAERDG